MLSVEQLASVRRQRDRHPAAVLGRPAALDDAAPLERVEDPGRRWGRHAGGVGELNDARLPPFSEPLEQSVLRQRERVLSRLCRDPAGAPDRLRKRIKRGQERVGRVGRVGRAGPAGLGIGLGTWIRIAIGIEDVHTVSVAC